MKKVNFIFVFLRKWLKKSLKVVVLRFLPMALLASVADAAVLYGIRGFMDVVNGTAVFSLWLWLGGMVALVFLRLLFLYGKSKISENWLYGTSARVSGWFLHRLRLLSPRVFHTPSGERSVEAAYEAIQVLQNNGAVFFQAVQAVLQLGVFLPVLFYISYPLALFLFVVVVPLVAFLQRRLHRLGPAEEQLMQMRSSFRGDLLLARRLFRQWSSGDERCAISQDLLQSVRGLKNQGLSSAVKKDALSLVAEAVSVLAMVLVLAFCALLMARGLMDALGLVLFSSAVLLCYKPVKECARVMPQFRSAVSALNILDQFERLPLACRGACGSKVSAGICIDKGHFFYEGSGHNLFENLDLNLPSDKPVLVRGKNGAGKSTLLRLLAGLEHWQGCGECSTSLKDVFFVAQDLELPPRLLLQRLLDTAPKLSKNILDRFAVESGASLLLGKSAMSGGERTRVALLWALVSKAPTVLLDEPFASVALEDREPLLNLYLNAAESLEKWTVVVSHDVLGPSLEAKFNVVSL